jgi:hypothetical protein
VLLSERDFARLCQDQTAQQGFLDFVQTWRTRMAADDLTALTEQEINELRDNAAGRDFSWEQ